MTDRRLTERAVLVTGAASGIGAATCRAFDREGARIVAVDINAAGCDLVVSGLADAISLHADLTVPDAVDDVVAQAVARYGRLDVVAHVAGVSDPASKDRIAECESANIPLDITLRMTDDQWSRMILINLTSAFYLTRAALRVMVPAGGGAIIHMASIAGVHGHPGLPHYSAAKAGLIGLTRSVAKEVATQGVRINAVAPSGVDTPMASPSLAYQPRPMGRLATAEEVAEVVVFLALDSSAYISGETININGGSLTV